MMSQNYDINKAKHEAVQLMRASKLEDALAAYEVASRHAPDDFEVWTNMGLVATGLRRLPVVETAFRRAFELKPDHPKANANMAQLMLIKQHHAEALPYIQRYVVLQPDVAEGHYQLGALHETFSNYHTAEKGYRDALIRDEKHIPSIIGLARVSYSNGDFKKVQRLCKQALQLKADTVDAYLLLMTVFRDKRRFDEALHWCQRLNEQMPQEREKYLNSMAQLFVDMERYDEALKYYTELLRRYPQSASGHWNYSMLLLLLGRYEEGWNEYNWRWLTPHFASSLSKWGHLAQPLWDGSSLKGRTILIYDEQGLGDTIQFGRYLPPLVKYAGRVIFHCRKELMGLFQRIPGLQVEERNFEKARQQSFDYHLPIMSLARMKGTTVDNILATTPYLQTDPERVAAWSTRINREGFKVGLVWQGSKKNESDRMRSMKLEDYAPLAQIPGIVLYSLQKEADAEELKTFTEQHELIDLAPQLSDFDETAAAIENLDLVISVDTAVAHMAGALGRPVWTLIYQPTEWRWLLNRDDSPWYPSMRLFRQTFEKASWPPVIAQVAEALRELQTTQRQE